MNILFSISIIVSLSPNTSANDLPIILSLNTVPCGTSCSVISIIPSWSLPIASSSAAASMPWLNTPRSLRASSTNGSSSTLAGTTVVGGNHTVTIPPRTFGAPHTTCISPYSSRGTSGVTPPSSIIHTLNLSASGCFSHFATTTMRAPAYRVPRSITCSTPPSCWLIRSTSSAVGGSSTGMNSRIVCTLTRIKIASKS